MSELAVCVMALRPAPRKLPTQTRKPPKYIEVCPTFIAGGNRYGGIHPYKPLQERLMQKQMKAH